MSDIVTSPSSPDSEPEWMNYRVGGVDFQGRQILRVIHRSPACAVYITQLDKDSLGVHAGTSCVDASTSMAEASNLLNELRSVIDQQTVRFRGCQIIGVELSHALEERVAGDTRDFFAGARQFVYSSLRERLNLRYLVAAFVTACVISAGCVIAVIYASSTMDFFIAAGLGGAGALVSVTQRFRRIPIEPYSSGFYISVAGVSRIFVGAVFGAVFLLFQNAGLLLSAANGNPSLLYSAAFVAGFSERMIPEILERFESTAGEDEIAKTT
jgi:hypothetical protein